ncbi:Adaptive-response sensory-kinase SasA [Eubacterium plexicaudatum ASF492]|uniref:histidine kinase n=1 Tax=Eubacterium plexicaudatum ASF492 TaxID=1235802 RepID=N2ARQ9_9FIRM|nr:Adaptive-response sensory-kinase SasA [Eubacterium plexicaudatum ASF492]
MQSELLCWILGGSLLCSILVLLLWAAWFFHQWRCLDAVLELFQKEDTWDAVRQNHRIDIRETRESRLASDIQLLLSRAAWRENEALREKKQVTELLSDLSHQLKTPLANIILDLDLLESNSAHMDAPQKKEFLSHVRTQASTMQWLVQNLLKAARLEDGMIRFQAENTNIRPTIAKAVSTVYAQAAVKNITICAEDIPVLCVYHNPKWTAEALANVLENAVKYSPEHTQIQIYAERMNIYTRITVQDEGPGIPETEYNKIFRRFYRAEQTGTAEGLGLGLYLTQLILQSEQGYVVVDSKLEQGSRFHFFLLNQK